MLFFVTGRRAEGGTESPAAAGGRQREGETRRPYVSSSASEDN